MAYLFPYAGAERRTVIKNVSPKIKTPKVPKVPKGRVKVEFVEAPERPPVAPPMMRQIMADVCEYHRIRPEELVARTRIDRLIRARRDFVVRAKRAGYSFVRIGRALNRDHSTMVYQYQCYMEGQSVDPDIPIYSQTS